MASVKLFSLAVRTLAKPIANTIKAQAQEHETFRRFCISIAQRSHRAEARLRMGLLNGEANNVKPLNDARAIQNGATTVAEAFLFMVAAGLVLGETWRSSRKEGKRRDDVAERLENLETEIKSLREALDGGGEWAQNLQEMREQNANLERVLSTVVTNGMKAGWFALGHQDSEILPLLEEAKAKPLPSPPETPAVSSRDLNANTMMARAPSETHLQLDTTAKHRIEQ